jgi:hypothetical protein
MADSSEVGMATIVASSMMSVTAHHHHDRLGQLSPRHYTCDSVTCRSSTHSHENEHLALA